MVIAINNGVKVLPFLGDLCPASERRDECMHSSFARNSHSGRTDSALCSSELPGFDRLAPPFTSTNKRVQKLCAHSGEIFYLLIKSHRDRQPQNARFHPRLFFTKTYADVSTAMAAAVSCMHKTPSSSFTSLKPAPKLGFLGYTLAGNSFNYLSGETLSATVSKHSPLSKAPPLPVPLFLPLARRATRPHLYLCRAAAGGAEGPPLESRGRAEEGEGDLADVSKHSQGEDATSQLAAICGTLVTIFPLWVGLATGAALWRPGLFLWLRGRLLVGALALTMLGERPLTRSPPQPPPLRSPRSLCSPLSVSSVMPLLGALIAATHQLSKPYALGIILAGPVWTNGMRRCGGGAGTASNIVTYLARGNVALSVLMTAASTLLAVVMTPVLTASLAGQLVPVDGAALFLSTVQVVLLPVVTGVAAAHYFPRAVKKISIVAPLVAVLTVAAMVGSAIASNAAAIRVTGGSLAFAVLCLHGGGFALGFLMSRILGFDPPTSRTISIEVGMQNSVLGVVLATQHFSDPLIAAPCAASSLCHSVVGSLLAAFWRFQSERESRAAKKLVDEGEGSLKIS
eukprot:jgi/Mesen1/4049/ME000213S03068